MAPSGGGQPGPESAEFWHQRWRANNIAFHASDTNPLLLRHFAELAVPPQGRVCVPLCGKTRDIAWLLSQGRDVAGIELSEIAVRQLFAELGIDPEIEEDGAIRMFRGPGVDIFCGDIFAVDRARLGPVDAVFDRAALTALPTALRDRYAPHLAEISAAAPQLLITYFYDQALMEGPPFSTEEADLRRLYEPSHSVALLEEGRVAELRTLRDVLEQVWLLKPRR